MKVMNLVPYCHQQVVYCVHTSVYIRKLFFRTQNDPQTWQMITHVEFVSRLPGWRSCAGGSCEGGELGGVVRFLFLLLVGVLRSTTSEVEVGNLPVSNCVSQS